jgi:uncharacterized repeat protein (TIGR01451 family)
MQPTIGRRLGTLLASVFLLTSFAFTLAPSVLADAGNPILGSITSSHTFNADGTVTVYVRGEWNWYSHGSDCNFNRAATGVGIIWNDPTETGYTVSKGAISADVGIASKDGSWADPNPLDPMVHPVDRGNIPEGYTAAGTDYPAGQQFADPASNDPADYASWRGGCGREPISATASKAGGPSCGDGTANCADRPWGSWGFEKNGGLGYSHTFRRLSDITAVCANFYDVHGGGAAGNAKFQLANGAKEITVDGNGDNSIETNAFNVQDGANCINVQGQPDLTVVKTADNATVAAGNPIGFTITATNSGNTKLTAVTLSDPLPTIAGLGIAWSVASSSPAGACAVAGLNLSCNFGDLAAGASASVHVTSPTTAPAAGAPAIAACTVTIKGHTANLDNTATVSSGNMTRTDRDGICITVTIPGVPHVTVTKTADAQTVLAGSPVGFTITVRSDGVGKALGVAINDALPTLANAGINWAISPAYAGPGSCAIGGAVPAQTLTCSFGDLDSGTSASVHVTSATTAPANSGALAPCAVTVVTYATNLNNSVQVTSTNAASSTAVTGTCVTTVKTPAIHIVKVANPTLLPIGGGTVVYSYTVTNTGNVALSNVSVVDDKCSPVVFLSGDTNSDARLDLTETWHYSCTTTITVTTINTAIATGHYVDQNGVDNKVTDQAQAIVTVPNPTPTPTGSVAGATSPPKPHVTLPPTDTSGPLGSSDTSSGLLMILVLLAGIVAAVPFLLFGKRRARR